MLRAVSKFGGSSVADAACVSRVVRSSALSSSTAAMSLDSKRATAVSIECRIMVFCPDMCGPCVSTEHAGAQT